MTLPKLTPTPSQPGPQASKLPFAPPPPSNLLPFQRTVLAGPTLQPNILIPQNALFVCIDFVVRSDSVNAGDVLQCWFNGDRGANYDFENASALAGVVAALPITLAATETRVGVIPGAGVGAGLWDVGWIRFNVQPTPGQRRGYTAMEFRNDTAFGMEWNSGAWRNTTDPIRNITFGVAGGTANFLAGCIFALTAW